MKIKQTNEKLANVQNKIACERADSLDVTNEMAR